MFKKLKLIPMSVICLLLTACACVIYAVNSEEVGGGLWMYWTSSGRLHSEYSHDFLDHTTSTGYRTWFRRRDIVCHCSGITKPGKVARSETETRYFMADRAWWDNELCKKDKK